MTSTAGTNHAPLPAAPTPPLAHDLWDTIRLAAPMALTQLSQIAMMSTDLAFIGRLGGDAVAAAALAGTVYFVGSTFGMGLMSAVAPLAAQAFGADDAGLVRRALRVGLWAGLFIALPIMMIALNGEAILLGLGQAQGVAHLAQEYLAGLAWGIAPMLWFLALRSFMGAVNRPEPVLWITLAAIPLNALLVYLLLYGHWGFPRLGLTGVGVATSVVNTGTFLAGLWFAAFRPPFRDYHVLARLAHVDWRLMRQLLVIGAPISLSFLLEYGLFSAAAILMGLISTPALAAHQIALQITAILFMVPFGISMAATVRVGHAAGRNDASGVRRAGLMAMLLGLSLAALFTLGIVATRHDIVQLFLGAGLADAEATAVLAATLLLVGTTFFITDALQTIAVGALRGIKDTRVPLLLAVLGYWLIGFPASYALGLRTNLGAIGIWIGLSIGTTIYAALLVLRFLRLSR